MGGKARVHELARDLGVTSQQLLIVLRAQGELVKSASSTVEAPVARRIRDTFAGGWRPPAPIRRPSETLPTEAHGLEPVRLGAVQSVVSEPIVLPVDGKASQLKLDPFAVRTPDPVPTETPPTPHFVTANEASEIMGVPAATIRKWVSRGYLQRSGSRGRAALYDVDDLMQVRRDTRSRTYSCMLQPTLYLPPKYHNRAVTTSEVARFYDIAPATVRAWVSRGRLTPIGRTGRQNLFRIRDVLRAGGEWTASWLD